MRAIRISLPDALFRELETASAQVREHGFGPAEWAAEIIEAEMASRRLPGVRLGTHGPRIAVETEPEGFPVHCVITGGEL